MKEKETMFTVNGKEYKAIFNLNVMQSIQVEYGTFESWGELTDGFVYDENGERKLKLDSDGNPIIKKIKNKNGEEVEVEVYETKEVDIKALIFGIKEMINEAIDIDNENNQLNQPLLTEKQVGRLITAMGIEKATSKLNETVIESTKDDTPKNE
ncbi:MAG: hypothetical protein KIC90_04490 [Firmicutes bacterium]|jgi:hypothetical protein|nr:hypothetical protein [Bacillota bacterium]DAZ19449.1 MAG TPA: hypothetical protein [Caudoviricetes sp.]